MAATTPIIPLQRSPHKPPKMTSIKTLAESSLTSIPSSYTFTTEPKDPNNISDPNVSIPIIDFSLLTSGTPDQRSKVIHDLGKACQEWGFFMVINHGVSEGLMKAIIDACGEFFNLTEEEKREFEGKHVLDPIRCGTSFNASVEKVFFWRDFLKVFVHPEFHSPNKPVGFSEISFQYCKKIREVGRELLKGISVSLGLEANYMNFENGLEMLIANLYPPCPQPEFAMGMPPHTDQGFLTILVQNGVGGLQIQHEGKWVHVNAVPNSFLVNTANHIEILSNGKYKSVVHRAVVNNQATRISIAIGIGPPLETSVIPAPELIDNESNPPAFIGMKYKDYFEFQQSNQVSGKSCLDRLRVSTF